MMVGFSSILQYAAGTKTTLYYIVKRLAEHSLKKQGMPTDTADYIENSR